MHMYVIAFMNQKGGAGKTTSAVHVAAALAAEGGARTLLLDNDSQGNATLMLGMEKSGAMSALYEDERPDLDALAIQARERLFVVPSDLTLADAAQRAGHARPLARLAAAIEQRFDALVIDNPPALDARSLAAMQLAAALGLRGAQSGIVVALPAEPLAIDGMGELMGTAERLAEEDAAPPVAAVVPTLYDARTNLATDALAELREAFGARVTTPVRRSIRLTEAPAHGQTIYEYDPSGRGAEDYHAVTADLIELLQNQTNRNR